MALRFAPYALRKKGFSDWRIANSVLQLRLIYIPTCFDVIYLNGSTLCVLLPVRNKEFSGWRMVYRHYRLKKFVLSSTGNLNMGVIGHGDIATFSFGKFLNIIQINEMGVVYPKKITFG